MVAPLLSNHTHHINRIASDTGNPRLSAELQDAIRNRMAFLFVRGADGFVLKPLAEDGVIGVLVWVAVPILLDMVMVFGLILGIGLFILVVLQIMVH
jgi:hypothetical protein